MIYVGYGIYIFNYATQSYKIKLLLQTKVAQWNSFTYWGSCQVRNFVIWKIHYGNMYPVHEKHTTKKNTTRQKEITLSFKDNLNSVTYELYYYSIVPSSLPWRLFMFCLKLTRQFSVTSVFVLNNVILSPLTSYLQKRLGFSFINTSWGSSFSIKTANSFRYTVSSGIFIKLRRRQTCKLYCKQDVVRVQLLMSLTWNCAFVFDDWYYSLEKVISLDCFALGGSKGVIPENSKQNSSLEMRVWFAQDLLPIGLRNASKQHKSF